MLIYIIRHGETEANREGYLQGWRDEPLNESGRALAVITGQRMRDIRFDACISSPLCRARETAEIILREQGRKVKEKEEILRCAQDDTDCAQDDKKGGRDDTCDDPAEIVIETDERIKEIHMGEWEHKRIRGGECEVDPEQMKYFFNNPFAFPGFPGGENARQVMERTQAFLKELLARDDGKTYLVATHGFALRAMLNCLYEDPSDFWHGRVPYNCAVNVIEGKNGQGKLIAEDRIYYDPEQVVDRYEAIQN